MMETPRNPERGLPALSRRTFFEMVGGGGLGIGAVLAGLELTDFASDAKADGEAASPDALKALADRLDKQFKALEASIRDLPRDRFDPSAVLAFAGREPSKILQWVRDNTTLAPYRGMLRGAVGVLMDRMGNSLDRSLLLADLLRQAGHSARLTNAQLSQDDARQLLDKTKPHQITANVTQQKAPNFEALARSFGLDAAQLTGQHQSFSVESQRLRKELQQRVQQQAALIQREIAGISGAPRAQDARAGVESLRDHWWVQIEQNGKWADLDPCTPELKTGPHVAAQHTITPDDRGKFKLDDSHRHELRIRLIVERWEKDTLHESTALEQVLRPSDYYGQRIMLAHVPGDWPEQLDAADPQEGVAKIKEAAARQKSWTPMLLVGESNNTKLAFDDGGKTKTPGQKEDKGSPAGLGFGGFGGFGGGGDEAPQSKLTAEWIEFEIRTPGGSNTIERRDIFDLIGPAARTKAKGKKIDEPSIDDDAKLKRGLALLERIEILPLACQIDPTYVDYLFARDLLANREFLMGAVNGATSGQKTSARPAPLPSQLYNWAVARQSWSTHAGGVYLDRINLAAYRLQLGLDSAGDLTVLHGFDIVANNVAAMPQSSGDPFATALQQGIAETNAEALLETGLGPVKNTAELMQRSAAGDVKWLAFRDSRDQRWEQVEIVPDIRARIDQDLARGYAVVVPTKPIALAENVSSVGWWRVHPVTGETLGRMESGAGQALTERVIKQGILFLPSGIAMGLKYKCGKEGRTDGMCNPCLIAAIGIFGCFLGFANAAVAWTLSETGTVAFAVLGVGKTGYDIGKQAASCVGHVLDNYAH